MKKLISNNWQKLLIGIGCILLGYLFFSKLIAPKTIIKDYISYGKVVQSQNINESGIVSGAKNNFLGVWGSVNPELARLTVILMVGILLVVFLSAIASKAGEKKDAKKK